MEKLSKLLIVIFIFIITISLEANNNNFSDLFNKKEVTILVTDSGLGGLSVVADLAKKLPKSGVFKNVRIVFFNSLFDSESGYNYLNSEEEKLRIFDIVLNSMGEKYNPDLLLIACNTLSVIYDKTQFAKNEKFPVIGIVETGVDIIVDEFEKKPNSQVIIFATETTIGANSHKNLLIKYGYSPKKIIGQPCSMLASYIESGYNSEMTAMIISEYVNQALTKIDTSESNIFASLNCTHYGYSIQLFKDAFIENEYSKIEVINPNSSMANFLFIPEYKNRYDETKVTVEVVSKVNISDKKINSLGNLIKTTSPKTAEATLNYLYDSNLFNIK